MTWPPTLEDVKKLASEPLPEEFQRFLSLMFSGNTRTWKLAKHILICMIICCLYRSKQLTTILNRLCHCELYSFGIELETAMVYALEKSNTYLTPQIVTGESNEVFHNEWDNLNKILSNVTGSNVVISAAGVMFQEFKGDTG